MSYTLGVTPRRGDVTLADIPDAKRLIAEAWPGVLGNFSAEGAKQFFVRAAELLPRVIERFGRPDVQGTASSEWIKVVGAPGVLYLEDCYQTDGDKKAAMHLKTFMVSNKVLPPIFAGGVDAMFTSGDHWDLFDGRVMVADGDPIAHNRHPGQMYFWRAK
ncbi:MAG TPA: hypothetical protein VD970_11010 [Acetobacteraceae bacterium]|nr:hypothetical protein [Acetobacteraceae bacterium]